MPEPTTAETAPKKETPRVSDDPFITQLVNDMGFVVKNGELEAAKPAPETAPTQSVQTFVTLGEHARNLAERNKDASVQPEVQLPAGTADKKEGEKTADKEAVTPDPKDETPKVDPPVKREAKVERIKPIEEIVEGAVRRAMEENKEEPERQVAPKQEEKKPDPDAEYIEALDDDRKADLEVLQFAAAKEPQKYGKLVKEQVSYYRKLDSFIAERSKNDGWDPDTDPELRTFVQSNRPKIQKTEMRRLERAMVADEATRQVEEKLKPEIEQATSMARAQEIRPAVEEAAKDYANNVYSRFSEVKDASLSQVVKAAQEKKFAPEGWAAAEEADRLAAGYVKAYATQAVDLGKEYLELVSGVKRQSKYDPNLPQDHKVNVEATKQAKLFQFIARQEASVERAAPAIRVREGKQFVTRQDFAAMTPQQRSKHWTLTHDDVLDSLAIAARDQAEIAFQQEVQRLKEAGFERTVKKQDAKKEERKEEAPKAVESPKATVTPSPGAGATVVKPTTATVFTEDEVKRSWTGGEKRWKG